MTAANTGPVVGGRRGDPSADRAVVGLSVGLRTINMSHGRWHKQGTTLTIC